MYLQLWLAFDAALHLSSVTHLDFHLDLASYLEWDSFFDSDSDSNLHLHLHFVFRLNLKTTSVNRKRFGLGCKSMFRIRSRPSKKFGHK